MGKTFQREVQMCWIQDDLLFHWNKDKGYLGSKELPLAFLCIYSACLRSDNRKKLPVTRIKSSVETVFFKDSRTELTSDETL